MNHLAHDAGAAPLYFSSGGETLFGWLHRPPETSPANMGLVICNPFGYEAICAHRSLRSFAAAATAIGIPVLRFDYSGSGDSTEGSPDTDQVAQWTADILAAAETLRRECRVERVCLLGLRLGALLAAVAAAKSDAIDALIAVAPVVNGRRYLRELRTFQASSVMGPPVVRPDGHLEVTGFKLSAASMATLGQIDLTHATVPPARRLLIVDRDDMPAAKPWSEGLLAQGAAVDYESLPGFSEMMSTPHASQIPQAMIDATVTWLHRLRLMGGADTSSGMSHSAAGLSSAPVSMDFRGDGGRDLTERAVFVDAQRILFSIVTLAKDAKSVRRGVVLLNTGATNHVGPNRMYVSLARRWAARGCVVLRLDLAGLGDSATRPGEPDNVVYPPGALDDIATAVEYLRRTYGVEDITLAGLCAGAYHALRAAAAGLPVNLTLMINPLTYFWKQGMIISDLQISEVVRNPAIYRGRVLSGSAWRRVLSGRVNLWRIAVVFARRAMLSITATLRDIARRLHIHLPDDLAHDLQSIAARGVRMVFVFARGDGGDELLRIEAGATVDAIGDGCRVYTLDGADHIFSQRDPRERLEKLLGSELAA